MRIGILTGGGDAPGLNGVIESVTRTLLQHKIQVIGIKNGFEGIYKQNIIDLNLNSISHAHSFAGTILGSSNKSAISGNEDNFISQYKKLQLDGLVVCGGDGTFKALEAVKNEVNFIGVPKTIDNDLHGTDITFGFDTACTVVSESVDALRYTAEAHERIIVVETMGRTAGWISLYGGLSSYADIILIPERPYSKEKLFIHLNNLKNEGKKSIMVVAAEGAFELNSSQSIAFTENNSPEKNRLGGFAFQLSRQIEKELSWESRHVVLGHLQRSRPPSHFDRILTLQFGIEASTQVLNKNWGNGIVYKNGKIDIEKIEVLMQGARNVNLDHEMLKKAANLGIFI